MCLFCDIKDKKIPSYIINENDDFLAFLDIGQTSKGHTLVIPKIHVTDIFDIKTNTGDFLRFCGQTASILKSALNFQSINIISNNGNMAGQSIFHLHFHLIPRYKNDNLEFLKENIPKSTSYLDDLYKQIIKK